MISQPLVLGMLCAMSLLLLFTTQLLLLERAKSSEAVGRYEELRIAMHGEQTTRQQLLTLNMKLQDTLALQLQQQQQQQGGGGHHPVVQPPADEDADSPTALKRYAARFAVEWQGDPNPPLTESFIRRVRHEHPVRPYYPTRDDLLRYFHYGDDPYAAVVVDADTNFAGGYVSYAELTAALIRETVLQRLGGPPRFVIEVGSFVGSSIVHVWAPLVKLHPQGLMLTVDTWLGDLNMRVLPEFKQFLRPVHGFPSLGTRMLQRMVFTNNSDVVVPLPLSSLVAARALAFCEFTIDLIYVDSAHEKGETFAELVLFYKLIRPGGLICGDDYFGWPAVRHDVNMFSTSINEPLIQIDGARPANPNRPQGGQWCIQKPK